MTTTGDPITDRKLSELRAAEDDRIRRIMAPLVARVAELERRLDARDDYEQEQRERTG